MAGPREHADQIGGQVADHTVSARQSVQSRRTQALDHALNFDTARRREQTTRVAAIRAHRRTLDTATHRTMQDTGPIEPQITPNHEHPQGDASPTCTRLPRAPQGGARP